MLTTRAAAPALEIQIWRAKTKQHAAYSVCGKRNPDSRSWKGNSPSLLASLLFTALALGRAVCCAARAEPSTHLFGASSRRPLLIPVQELVREVPAHPLQLSSLPVCPLTTLLSFPSDSVLKAQLQLGTSYTVL